MNVMVETVGNTFLKFYQQKILPGEVIQILATVLKTSPVEILLNFNRRLSLHQRKKLQKILKGVQKEIPLDYLLGETEFMGIKLKVVPGVFIPRPETELLVEEVIKDYRDWKEKKLPVLDVGCGTGNIAIALAKFLPGAFVWSIEKSQLARKVARENIIREGLREKVKLIAGDIEKSFKRLPRKYFEIIVSNPPYVETHQIRRNRFEPALALDGGKDGLKFYHCLGKLGPHLLKPGGKIFLEIGATQSNSVKKILQASGFSEIKIVTDYQGLDRIVSAKWSGYGKNYY